MDEKIQELINLIEDALENVGEEYYQLNTIYRPINRERVFCYELYHQMRLLQDGRKLNNIQIHGEIDKRGHINFKGAHRNPDFVFHIPGNMEGNTIVVEVKGRIENNNGVYKDIETLSKFTDKKLYYRAGVLIIYNYSIDEFWNRTGEYIINKLSEDKYNTDKIIIISKKHKNTPFETVKLNDLLRRVKNGRA